MVAMAESRTEYLEIPLWENVLCVSHRVSNCSVHMITTFLHIVDWRIEIRSIIQNLLYTFAVSRQSFALFRAFCLINIFKWREFIRHCDCSLEKFKLKLKEMVCYAMFNRWLSKQTSKTFVCFSNKKTIGIIAEFERHLLESTSQNICLFFEYYRCAIAIVYIWLCIFEKCVKVLQNYCRHETFASSFA